MRLISVKNKNKERKLSLMTVLESITQDNKKGKMVALFIPEMIGSKLQQMFSDVPGEMVAPEDMHITLGLMYGDREEDKKVLPILKDLASSIAPADVEISHFGVFPPNEHNHGKHVLWAKPSSDSIHHIRDTIFDLFAKHGLKIDNGSFDFNPHITIKYCDEQPTIDQRVDNPVFRIKDLSFASGGDKYHLPMRGRK
jgi:2'-5' RNA ligase